MRVFHNLLFLLYLLVIIMPLAMTGCGNSPQAAQAKIDRMAKDMQANLPKMLDKDTRLVKVYAKKMELVSEYELVNFEMNEENRTPVEVKIKSYLKLQLCPSLKKELLNLGISARYIYKEKNGQTVVDQVLAKGDC